MGLEQGWHTARFQKLPPRGGDERPNPGGSGLKFRDERCAAIDHGDNVLEVVADNRILPSPVMKRCEFCRQEAGRRDQPNHRPAGHSEWLGRVKGFGVPLGLEAQHDALRWHDVDDLPRRICESPAAAWSAWRHILFKAKLHELIT